MKLKQMTEEQRAFLQIKKKDVADTFLSYQEINKKKSIELITFVYSLIKKPCPKIFVVDSPLSAQRLANKMKETKKKFYQFGTFLTCYWA